VFSILVASFLLLFTV